MEGSELQRTMINECMWQYVLPGTPLSHLCTNPNLMADVWASIDGMMYARLVDETFHTVAWTRWSPEAEAQG